MVCKRGFFERLDWTCADPPEELAEILLPARAFVVENGFLGEATLFCAPAVVSIQDLADVANSPEGETGGAISLRTLWQIGGCPHVVALPRAPELVHRPLSAGVDWLEARCDTLDWTDAPRTALGLLCSVERTYLEARGRAHQDRLEARGFWLPLYFLKLCEDPSEMLYWGEHRGDVDDAAADAAEMAEQDHAAALRRPDRAGPGFDRQRWIRDNRPNLPALNQTIRGLWGVAVNDALKEFGQSIGPGA